jgi:hypothetical protein
MTLLDKLTEDFPQEKNYRADLALTLSGQAKAAQAANEHA